MKKIKFISARKVVMVSFLVDVLDVVTNLIVALLTGSAVVFGEMAQGIADSIGSALLVIGERRAKLPRDEKHPLGYAREAFFWSLLSAVAISSLLFIKMEFISPVTLALSFLMKSRV